MRKYTTIIAAALLLGGYCFPTYAATKETNAIYREARRLIQRKNYVEAQAKADEALKNDKLDAADKARFLSLAGEAVANRGSDFYPIAQRYFERILSDNELNNQHKIEGLKAYSEAYLKSLTGQYLERMDIGPSHAILNRALSLPGLTPEEQAAALLNIGDLYARQDDHKNAQSTFNRVLELNVKEDTKNEAWKAIASDFVNAKQNDKAIDIYRKQNFDLIPLYKRIGYWNEATALLTQILDDPQSNDQQKWNAFSKLPIFRGNGGGVSPRRNLTVFRANLKEIRALSEKYLPGLIQSDPNRAKVLLRSIRDTEVFYNTYYFRTIVFPEYVAWAAPMVLNVETLSKKDYEMVRIKYINALAALGDNAKTAGFAELVQRDEKISTSKRLWAKLVNTALTSDLENATKVARSDNKGIPSGERASAVVEAAQTLLQSGDELKAKALYNVYKEIVPDLPKPEIKSTFMAKAPQNLTEWLASPVLKSRAARGSLNRPYGDNLKQVIETDATSGDRGSDTTKQKDESNKEGYLYTVTDPEGIYLFLDLRDSRAQEVVDGFINGGSVEMYLAPGHQQPYYTFIYQVPSHQMRLDNSPTKFITMYPNPGNRLPSIEDGTMSYNTSRMKNGFGTVIFLSWELFYDKLPANGDRWQIEPIHWTRSGGYSYGGSESVHHRSEWGDIVFEGLTPKSLNVIKRNLVLRAVTKYRDSIKSIMAPVARWEDAELGDPVFYKSEVKPFIDYLNRYADRVNKEMTAQDVEIIFNEAVPDMMEIDYRVQVMRARYLERKAFGG